MLFLPSSFDKPTMVNMIVLAAFLMDQALLRLGDCTVARIWPGGEGKARPEVRDCEKPEDVKQYRQQLLGF